MLRFTHDGCDDRARLESTEEMDRFERECIDGSASDTDSFSFLCGEAGWSIHGFRGDLPIVGVVDVGLAFGAEPPEEKIEHKWATLVDF
jgi:hypothetical protein